ncbi:hypothetical protein LCI18_007269 [Fusarium solani-melongenae]|uniref:Uncharacterized protein n=1 Tax=Fusarium solani subsp. cucurbitae TaxID=2747967 RepID=A0ACD3Z507_FUSSC|nr:hypothetical protein LCI18_007269 [Fusarium solani-melongenae]
MAEASGRVTSDTAAENGTGWSDRPRRKLSVEAIAITGCVVAFLSLIVTIVALLPSFKGEELAIAQLKLAVWTASNEYLQQCRDQSKSGSVSSDCEEAMKRPVKPPPSVYVSANYGYSGCWLKVLLINQKSRMMEQQNLLDRRKMIPVPEYGDGKGPILIKIAVASAYILMILLPLPLILVKSERNGGKKGSSESGHRCRRGEGGE